MKERERENAHKVRGHGCALIRKEGTHGGGKIF